jgi:hypothetical protein
MKRPEQEEELESGWTMDEILIERGYSPEYIAERRARREAKLSASTS